MHLRGEEREKEWEKESVHFSSNFLHYIPFFFAPDFHVDNFFSSFWIRIAVILPLLHKKLSGKKEERWLRNSSVPALMHHHHSRSWVKSVCMCVLAVPLHVILSFPPPANGYFLQCFFFHNFFIVVVDFFLLSSLSSLQNKSILTIDQSVIDFDNIFITAKMCFQKLFTT